MDTPSIIFLSYCGHCAFMTVIGLILSNFIKRVDDMTSSECLSFIFIPGYSLYFMFKYLNYYLTQNNLKQMNLKILIKAMGFMFLPTLGVLLLLLIGFFDPILLWTWIKSSSGWAVFTRIVIFLLEAGLVTFLYFDYLKKDRIEKIKNSAGAKDTKTSIEYGRYARDMFYNATNQDEYFLIPTDDPNFVIIEFKKK